MLAANEPKWRPHMEDGASPMQGRGPRRSQGSPGPSVPESGASATLPLPSALRHIAWRQCPQREAGCREQPNADHLSEEIIWRRITRAGENLQKEHLNEGSIWRKIIHAQEYLEEEHLNQRSVWGSNT